MLNEGLQAVLDALDAAHEQAERLRLCEQAGVADPREVTDAWNELDLKLSDLQKALGTYGAPASRDEVLLRQEPPTERGDE